jgi:hypothetical protein
MRNGPIHLTIHLKWDFVRTHILLMYRTRGEHANHYTADAVGMTRINTNIAIWY